MDKAMVSGCYAGAGKVTAGQVWSSGSGRGGLRVGGMGLGSSSACQDANPIFVALHGPYLQSS